jgi:hypothetical protein
MNWRTAVKAGKRFDPRLHIYREYIPAAISA